MTPTVAPTPEQQEAARYEMARRHLLPFVVLTMPRYQVNPVSKLLAAELEEFERQVAAKTSPRLIIEIPPRIGKSQLTSRHGPAWMLGRNPHWSVGIVSYGADLSTRLSRDARTIVMSDAFGRVFAKYDTENVEDIEEAIEIDKSAKAAEHWRLRSTKEVPQPGGVLATGINGALTGHGFDVLVIDDPHKNWEEAQSLASKNRVWDYYSGTLYDRVEPGGGIIVVMQRWAEDDLVGRLIASEEITEDDDGFDVDYVDKWRRIRLPAQAEAGDDDPLGREPGEWLMARRTVEQWERAKANNLKKNKRIWYAKFQQRPTPPEGVIFQVDEWLRFEDEPEDAPEGPIYIFGDTSYAKRQNSDYNAFTVWRMERHPQLQFRLLEVYRKRSTYPDLRRDVINLCAKYDLLRPHNVMYYAPRVYIEDAKSGQSLIQDFMRPVQHPEHGFVRIPCKAWPMPDKSKDARAHSVTSTMAERRVILPKKAPWLADYISELRNYQGEGSIPHDDQVDSTTMALILMSVQQPVQRKQVGHVPFQIVA